MNLILLAPAAVAVIALACTDTMAQGRGNGGQPGGAPGGVQEGGQRGPGAGSSGYPGARPPYAGGGRAGARPPYAGGGGRPPYAGGGGHGGTRPPYAIGGRYAGGRRGAPFLGVYGYPGYAAYPYTYAIPSTYAYSGYVPYPAYVGPAPVVYVERPRVIAAVPSPQPPPPPVAAPAPPARLERYRLSAHELFAFDHDELRPPQSKLDEIAQALINNPAIPPVTITGFTDRLGTESHNLALSWRRAEAVKAYLVAKGVAADRLVAVGKGEASPLVHCDDKQLPALIACLEPNRRVEVESIVVERRAG